mgnify:CR=1 FL=1
MTRPNKDRLRAMNHDLRMEANKMRKKIATMEHYIADAKIAVGLMQEDHKAEVERLMARCAALKTALNTAHDRIAGLVS